jgi:hypothetical protein
VFSPRNTIKYAKNLRKGKIMSTFTYSSEQEVLDAAQIIERARYWQEVKSIAQDVSLIFEGQIYKTQSIADLIYEEINKHEYIIYPHNNLVVLRFTENEEACFGMGIQLDGDYITMLRQIATEAMKADIQDTFEKSLEVDFIMQG